MDNRWYDKDAGIKYTRWYEGEKKPDMDGIYQRRVHRSIYWCKFQKGSWYLLFPVGVAGSWEVANESDKISVFQTSLRWRGLDENPLFKFPM